MLFEVLAPGAAGTAGHTILVEAANWRLALRETIDELALDPGIERRATCEIRADRSVLVADEASGARLLFRVLAELPDQAWDEEEPVVTVSLLEPEDRPGAVVARCTTDQLDAVLSRLMAEPEPEVAVVVESPLDEVRSELEPLSRLRRDIDRVANLVLEVALRHVPARVGWVLVRDREAEELAVTAARGARASQALDARMPMGRGLAGHCAATGLALALTDASSDPRTRLDLAASLGITAHSAACVPARQGDRVVAVIQLLDRRGGPFTPRDLTILDAIATELARHVPDLAVWRPPTG